MKRRRTRWAPCLLLVLGGCAAGPIGPDDLELVRLSGASEPEPPTVYLFHLSTLAPERSGLWVPLPGSDRFQEVRHLALEVGPPGEYRVVETEGGVRLLHVPAPAEGRAHVAVRARIDRYAAPRGGAPPLPPAAQEVAREDPERFVAAARARGLRARLGRGLELTPQGATERVSWPELELEREWLPVDLRGPSVGLPPGCVRLPGSAPRAELEGEPVEAETQVWLERRGG